MLKTEALTMESKLSSVWTNGTGFATTIIVDCQYLFALKLAQEKGPNWDANDRMFASDLCSHSKSIRLDIQKLECPSESGILV